MIVAVIDFVFIALTIYFAITMSLDLHSTSTASQVFLLGLAVSLCCWLFFSLRREKS